MYGRLEKIWHNRRADGSEYWVLSIDNQRYTVSNRDLIRNIHDGDFVEFAFTSSGRYRTIITLKRNVMKGREERDQPCPETHRDTRLHCLRTAALLVQDSDVTPERKPKLAMDVARKLERYAGGNPTTVDRIKAGGNGSDSKEGEA